MGVTISDTSVAGETVRILGLTHERNYVSIHGELKAATDLTPFSEQPHKSNDQASFCIVYRSSDWGQGGKS